MVVETRVAEVQSLKRLAATSGSAVTLQAAGREKYPAYSGENYLDPSVVFFFPAPKGPTERAGDTPDRPMPCGIFRRRRMSIGSF